MRYKGKGAPAVKVTLNPSTLAPVWPHQLAYRGLFEDLVDLDEEWYL